MTINAGKGYYIEVKDNFENSTIYQITTELKSIDNYLLNKILDFDELELSENDLISIKIATENKLKKLLENVKNNSLFKHTTKDDRYLYNRLITV